MRWPGICGLLAALAFAACGSSDEARPGAGKGADRSPARRAAPRTDAAAVAARSRIPVLSYHQIRRVRPGDDAEARPYIVEPARFAEQMAALDRAGYEPVSGGALVAHLARGAPLGRRPVLITFDDGTAGQYTRALPVLERHGFTATFFVMTVVLDKPGWLSRRQVRALDRAGMTIGAHTWDHQPVPEYAEEDWPVQIEAPTRELSELVGHPVRLFAYPFGRWSPEAIPRLWGAGLRAAFQLEDDLDPRHPLWSIRRIIVPDWSGERLLREMGRSF